VGELCGAYCRGSKCVHGFRWKIWRQGPLGWDAQIGGYYWNRSQRLRLVRCGVNWYGSGEGPVARYCEHCNDIEQREREREMSGGWWFPLEPQLLRLRSFDCKWNMGMGRWWRKTGKFRYSEKYLSKADLGTTCPTWNGLDGDEISGFIIYIICIGVQLDVILFCYFI
jgi:hypothetical protein